MAENFDNNLPNGHATFLGTSGAGKSTLIKQLPRYQQADILIAYDPLAEHDVRHFRNDFNGFKQAIIEGFKTGKRTRVGYVPPDLPPGGMSPAQEMAWKLKQVEMVSQLVWVACDGRLPLLYLIEEAGDAINAAGGISGYTGTIIRKARKYGVDCWFSAQRSQNIPKDVTGNCSNKYLMKQDDMIDCKKSADIASATAQDILHLKPGEYYHVATNQPTQKKRTRKP